MEIFDLLLTDIGYNITVADAVATTLSIIGIVLNAMRKISCWPVWLGSNVFWVIFGVAVTIPSLVLMNVVFFFGNMFGWYQWRKTEANPATKTIIT